MEAKQELTEADRKQKAQKEPINWTETAANSGVIITWGKQSTTWPEGN